MDNDELEKICDEIYEEFQAKEITDFRRDDIPYIFNSKELNLLEERIPRIPKTIGKIPIIERIIIPIEDFKTVCDNPDIEFSDIEVIFRSIHYDNSFEFDLSYLKKFTKLRRIAFYEYFSENIAEAMGEMKWLESIDIRFGNFTQNKYPPSTFSFLSTLDNLTSLSLRISFTNIGPLLDEICNIYTLEKLALAPILKTASLDVSKLIQLKHLDLSSTHLERIIGLENLIFLESLNIWSSDISDLSGIEKLYNLESVTIADTKIDNLNWCSELTNLKSLNIAQTRIKNFDVIQKLIKLEHLSIVFSRMTYAEFIFSPHSASSSMEFLDFNINFDQHVDLKSVHISNIGLREIPSSLCELTNLEKIDLSRNYIYQIPDIPMKSPGIREINLSDNPISNFPKWLTELKYIKKLDFRNNQLIEVPEFVLDFPMKCRINLTSDGLEEPSWNKEKRTFRNPKIEFKSRDFY